MKKSVIILICIGVGAVLLAACIWLAVVLVNRFRFKKDTLERVTVSTGGGMLGGHEYVTLQRERDGSCTLSVSRQETHADRERTVTYAADPAALERVKALVIAHNLYGASKRRYSGLRVLDGDTTSVAFSFETDYFSVSEEQIMSLSMAQGFQEVIAYLRSLATGEGVASIEPQRALLYLRSGYTLQFIVEDAFDGVLDPFFMEEHETAAFFDSGIILAEGVQLDCAHATAETLAEAGTIVYDPQGRQIVVFYEKCVFDHDVFKLAALDGYVDSACPLIAEMEGMYRLHLNQ